MKVGPLTEKAMPPAGLRPLFAQKMHSPSTRYHEGFPMMKWCPGNLAAGFGVPLSMTGP